MYLVQIRKKQNEENRSSLQDSPDCIVPIAQHLNVDFTAEQVQ